MEEERREGRPVSVLTILSVSTVLLTVVGHKISRIFSSPKTKTVPIEKPPPPSSQALTTALLLSKSDLDSACEERYTVFIFLPLAYFMERKVLKVPLCGGR